MIYFALETCDRRDVLHNTILCNYSYDKPQKNEAFVNLVHHLHALLYMKGLSERVIAIVMESPMYFQMPLQERFDLLKYLAERYEEDALEGGAIEEGKRRLDHDAHSPDSKFVRDG